MVMIVQGGVAEVAEGGCWPQLKNGGRIACLFMEGPWARCVLGYKSDHGIAAQKALMPAGPLLMGLPARRRIQL